MAEVLAHLERQHPGIRFRIVSEQNTIRCHINLFVNDRRTELDRALSDEDELHIICALSGG